MELKDYLADEKSSQVARCALINDHSRVACMYLVSLVEILDNDSATNRVDGDGSSGLQLILSKCNATRCASGNQLVQNDLGGHMFLRVTDETAASDPVSSQLSSFQTSKRIPSQATGASDAKLLCSTAYELLRDAGCCGHVISAFLKRGPVPVFGLTSRVLAGITLLATAAQEGNGSTTGDGNPQYLAALHDAIAIYRTSGFDDALASFMSAVSSSEEPRHASTLNADLASLKGVIDGRLLPCTAAVSSNNSNRASLYDFISSCERISAQLSGASSSLSCGRTGAAADDDSDEVSMTRMLLSSGLLTSLTRALSLEARARHAFLKHQEDLEAQVAWERASAAAAAEAAAVSSRASDVSGLLSHDTSFVSVGAGWRGGLEDSYRVSRSYSDGSCDDAASMLSSLSLDHHHVHAPGSPAAAAVALVPRLALQSAQQQQAKAEGSGGGPMSSQSTQSGNEYGAASTLTGSAERLATSGRLSVNTSAPASLHPVSFNSPQAEAGGAGRASDAGTVSTASQATARQVFMSRSSEEEEASRRGTARGSLSLRRCSDDSTVGRDNQTSAAPFIGVAAEGEMTDASFTARTLPRSSPPAFPSSSPASAFAYSQPIIPVDPVTGEPLHRTVRVIAFTKEATPPSHHHQRPQRRMETATIAAAEDSGLDSSAPSSAFGATHENASSAHVAPIMSELDISGECVDGVNGVALVQPIDNNGTGAMSPERASLPPSPPPAASYDTSAVPRLPSLRLGAQHPAGEARRYSPQLMIDTDFLPTPRHRRSSSLLSSASSSNYGILTSRLEAPPPPSLHQHHPHVPSLGLHASLSSSLSFPPSTPPGQQALLPCLSPGRSSSSSAAAGLPLASPRLPRSSPPPSLLSASGADSPRVGGLQRVPSLILPLSAKKGSIGSGLCSPSHVNSSGGALLSPHRSGSFSSNGQHSSRSMIGHGTPLHSPSLRGGLPSARFQLQPPQLTSARGGDDLTSDDAAADASPAVALLDFAPSLELSPATPASSSPPPPYLPSEGAASIEGRTGAAAHLQREMRPTSSSDDGDGAGDATTAVRRLRLSDAEMLPRSASRLGMAPLPLPSPPFAFGDTATDGQQLSVNHIGSGSGGEVNGHNATSAAVPAPPAQIAPSAAASSPTGVKGDDDAASFDGDLDFELPSPQHLKRGLTSPAGSAPRLPIRTPKKGSQLLMSPSSLLMRSPTASVTTSSSVTVTPSSSSVALAAQATSSLTSGSTRAEAAVYSLGADKTSASLDVTAVAVDRHSTSTASEASSLTASNNRLSTTSNASLFLARDSAASGVFRGSAHAASTSSLSADSTASVSEDGTEAVREVNGSADLLVWRRDGGQAAEQSAQASSTALMVPMADVTSGPSGGGSASEEDERWWAGWLSEADGQEKLLQPLIEWDAMPVLHVNTVSSVSPQPALSDSATMPTEGQLSTEAPAVKPLTYLEARACSPLYRCLSAHTAAVMLAFSCLLTPGGGTAIRRQVAAWTIGAASSASEGPLPAASKTPRPPLQLLDGGALLQHPSVVSSEEHPEARFRRLFDRQPVHVLQTHLNHPLNLALVNIQLRTECAARGRAFSRLLRLLSFEFFVPEHYDLGAHIASGAYGTVVAAEADEDGPAAAVLARFAAKAAAGSSSSRSIAPPPTPLLNAAAAPSARSPPLPEAKPSTSSPLRLHLKLRVTDKADAAAASPSGLITAFPVGSSGAATAAITPPFLTASSCTPLLRPSVAVKLVSFPSDPLERCVVSAVLPEVAVMEDVTAAWLAQTQPDAASDRDDSFSHGCPVVCLLDYGVTPWAVWLVMERCESSLAGWRREALSTTTSAAAEAGNDVITHTARLVMLLHLCQGVAHRLKQLHAAGVVHYDLKADNVLLRQGGHAAIARHAQAVQAALNTGREPPSYLSLLPFLAVADFGECDYAPGAPAWARVPLLGRGTECIKAPELLRAARRAEEVQQQQQRVTNPAAAVSVAADAVAAPAASSAPASSFTPASACDVWSAGCLVYELLTGSFLFQDDDWARFFLSVTGDAQLQAAATTSTSEPVTNATASHGGNFGEATMPAPSPASSTVAAPPLPLPLINAEKMAALQALWGGDAAQAVTSLLSSILCRDPSNRCSAGQAARLMGDAASEMLRAHARNQRQQRQQQHADGPRL